VKYRRQVGYLIPFTFFQVLWFTLAIRWNYFERYFPEYYPMALTMILGATVAGILQELRQAWGRFTGP
jgi:hypothetical protein